MSLEDDRVMRQLFFNMTPPLTKTPRCFVTEDAIESIARFEYILALRIRGVKNSPKHFSSDFERFMATIDALSLEEKIRLEEKCSWGVLEQMVKPIDEILDKIFPIITNLATSLRINPLELARKYDNDIRELTLNVPSSPISMPVFSRHKQPYIGFYSSSTEISWWSQYVTANGNNALITGFQSELPLAQSFYKFRRSFYFMPTKSRVLYNQYLCCTQMSPVILTPCLEMAHINQLHDELCTWASWDNRPGLIDTYDWTPLRGKSVYLLLMEHSGLSASQIINDALLIEDKLQSIKVIPRYISCLGSFTATSPTDTRMEPRLLSKAQFHQALRATAASAASKIAITRILTGDDMIIRSTFRPREISATCVLSPLIREKSINLVYSASPSASSGRLRFLVSMAYSIATGTSMLKDWHIGASVKTHFHIGCYSMLEFNDVLSQVTGPIPHPATKHQLTVSPSPPKEGDRNALNASDYSFIKMPEIDGGRGVLFIENINLVEYSKNLIPVLGFNIFLESQVAKGWTVIISGDGIRDKQATDLGKTMSFDSIIKLSESVESRSGNPELMVRVIKKPKGLDQPLPPFILEFVGRASEADPSSWRRARRSLVKGGIMKELEIINTHLTSGCKAAEISDKTGISHSLVRKRIEQLKGKELRDPSSNIRYTLKRNPLTGEVKIIKATLDSKEFQSDTILFEALRSRGAAKK